MGIEPARAYGLLRPLLFALEPERAHRLVLDSLSRVHALGGGRLLAPTLADDPVQLLGLRFANPVGLAAGLDKNAAHVDALAALGFGFLEVGTITPRPQAGNPAPRLFRLPPARALVNRFGFNNDGLQACLQRLARCRWDGVLGINLGKNATTPIEAALDDYLAGLRAAYPLACARPCYLAINISSPNTRDLRRLQHGGELALLLAGLASAREELAQRHGRRVPLAVKIGPDLADAELPQLAATLVEHQVDAVIATNTTIDRSAVAGLRHAQEAGGLSGAPLRQRATEVVGQLARHLQGALPVIGVGGILSGADAVEKLRAGARLVQLYTGLIYRGPALVAECRRAAAHWRAQSGPGASCA